MKVWHMVGLASGDLWGREGLVAGGWREGGGGAMDWVESKGVAVYVWLVGCVWSRSNGSGTMEEKLWRSFERPVM